MNEAPTPLLLLLLVGLIVVIAFSSGTEVALLSVNRYRIRHRAELGEGPARVLERLLQRPDDWLGVNLVILAAASVFASQAATVIAQRTSFAFALSVTGAILSIVMIVFGELVPKIFAATRSESVALGSAYIYRTLVVLARPVLWLTSRTAYGVLRLFGVVRGSRDSTALGAEELRAVVAEASPMIPARHRQMLLSILDLGEVTVNDIMIPRQEIAG
ncbi:MAG: CNNM domain-containing protein, partial [Steroidobacteraceae bacterium]